MGDNSGECFKHDLVPPPQILGKVIIWICNWIKICVGFSRRSSYGVVLVGISSLADAECEVWLQSTVKRLDITVG